MAAAAEEPTILTFKVYKSNSNYHRIGTPKGLEIVKDFFENKLKLGKVTNVSINPGGWGRPSSVYVEITYWYNDDNAQEFKNNILDGKTETVSYPGTEEDVLGKDSWYVEQYIPITWGRAGFRGGKKNRRHRKGKKKNKRTRNTRRHKNKRTRNTRRHKNKRTRNTRRRRRHK